MAFAISGIRLAATKRFDLFGAYVVGLVTAIGGGTIRDVLLGFTPIWMEQEIYVILTALSLLLVVVLGRHILRFESAFFIFDTIGLALFTIVGLDKALGAGFPVWVAIIMGMVTGSFGGVVRDILVGDVPLLFRRDIYALTSVFGGAVFVAMQHFEMGESSCFGVSIVCVLLLRFVAVKYHIHLPMLSSDGDVAPHISIHTQRDNEK